MMSILQKSDRLVEVCTAGSNWQVAAAIVGAVCVTLGIFCIAWGIQKSRKVAQRIAGRKAK